jgi:hypothetical protein
VIKTDHGCRESRAGDDVRVTSGHAVLALARGGCADRVGGCVRRLNVVTIR